MVDCSPETAQLLWEFENPILPGEDNLTYTARGLAAVSDPSQFSSELATENFITRCRNRAEKRHEPRRAKDYPRIATLLDGLSA